MPSITTSATVGSVDASVRPYSTAVYADEVGAFLTAIGVERAHVAGMSLGAAVGIHLAARALVAEETGEAERLAIRSDLAQAGLL